MDYVETKKGPVSLINLNHPVYLPVYRKVHHYGLHPLEGPAIAILSGGTGARALSETLIRYTHNSIHVLPVFDDGGSSRELRLKLKMPPPGDLRSRLMSLSDMTRSGNPEVSRLFRTRLPSHGPKEELQAELESYISDTHPQMAKIERRYRRIIMNHLDRFNYMKPADFDLRGGNIGNFVIAGSYLSVGDLESVIFEFSALAAVRGNVYPVCTGSNYHLKAEFEDGVAWVGQSRITSRSHAPICRLAIVEKAGQAVTVDSHPEGGSDLERTTWTLDDVGTEVQPELNPLAEAAIRKAALITYSMGSFYTSIISNLLVAGMGRAIRETKRPKVFVANLFRDVETPGITVSMMLKELYRYLCLSDPEPGKLEDYVQYILVSNHGASAFGGRVPVDLDAIQALGVEAIVLPLEKENPTHEGQHDAELVASVLISLC
jgi:CofD-related protein of GAK system